MGEVGDAGLERLDLGLLGEVGGSESGLVDAHLGGGQLPGFNFGRRVVVLRWLVEVGERGRLLFSSAAPAHAHRTEEPGDDDAKPRQPSQTKTSTYHLDICVSNGRGGVGAPLVQRRVMSEVVTSVKA